MTSGDILPTNPISQDLEFMGLPKPVIEQAITAASPALEYAILLHNFPSSWLSTNGQGNGHEIVVSEPPYDKVDAVRIRSVGDGEISLNYKGHVGSLSIDSLWADSAEPNVLESKIARQKAHQEAKRQFEDANPLGEGGVLLDNGYGGLDIDDPETTSRYLIMRTVLAKRAGVIHGKSRDLVKAGLIDRRLDAIIGDDLLNFMRSISGIIDTIEALPEASRVAATSHILEGAIENAKHFIESNASKVQLAALMAKDTKLTRELFKGLGIG